MLNSMVVYKIENKENGMVYIGATTKSVETRIKDHFDKARNKAGHKLHEAIWTFGPEAFCWEQINTASDINELAEKEKECIIKYNSKQEGYNADSGGGFKKVVFQYNIEDGSLVESFDSLESASSAVSATIKQVSRACLNVSHELNGYYWSYTYKEPFEPDKDKRTKEVIQMDEHFNPIRTYVSVNQASEVTGIDKSSIAKVCRGERNQAGGFNWNYL